MSTAESETVALLGRSDAVSLYCIASLVADQASKGGHPEFARGLESAMQGMLNAMNRDQQASALRLSYEIALGRTEPAPPRLRLVYSRD